MLSGPTHINLFEMNTIVKTSRNARMKLSSPANKPHEHFRSTGIRDGNEPAGSVYSFGSGMCVSRSCPLGQLLQEKCTVTLKENMCMANVWDWCALLPQLNT